MILANIIGIVKKLKKRVKLNTKDIPYRVKRSNANMK